MYLDNEAAVSENAAVSDSPPEVVCRKSFPSAQQVTSAVPSSNVNILAVISDKYATF